MRGKPVSDALGVELPDFDITRPCSAEEQAELRRLFCEHHLILVRSESMTDEDHDRFVQYFGPLSLMRDGKEAVHMTNQGPEKYGPALNSLLWHADGAYGEFPGIATSLWAVEAAEGATGTGFLNAVRALATLPARLRERIGGMSALHVRDMLSKFTDGRMRSEYMEEGAAAWRYRTYAHPIALRLPHADKRALFVNEQMTSHIVGMPREESEGLLQELLEHLKSPENIYMHTWRPGDVIIWDNIGLQHCRPADVGSVPRHLRRVTIDGWNTGDGVLDWIATAGLRDPVATEAYAQMASGM